MDQAQQPAQTPQRQTGPQMQGQTSPDQTPGNDPIPVEIPQPEPTPSQDPIPHQTPPTGVYRLLMMRALNRRKRPAS